MTIKHIQTNILYFRLPIQQQFGTYWAFHLIDKLEYWFSREKFHQAFYKFTAPCQKLKHLYKPGDSWTEVLGVSRKTFTKTFDLIGIRYKSEKAFKAEADPFKGKMYASYYNRMTYKTFYVRNHRIVQEFLQKLSETYLPQWANKTPRAIISEDNKDNSQNQSLDHTLPTSDEIKESVVTELASNGNNSQYGNGNFCQSKIQSPLGNSSSSGEEDIKLMLQIWHDLVRQDDIPKLSAYWLKSLSKVLQQQFEGCLNKWRAYCQKIASSKFLMGEKSGTTFKLWLRAAIRVETIERIWQDGFSFGDRVTAVTEVPPADLHNQALTKIEQQTCPQQQKLHRYLLEQGGIIDYGRWFQAVELTIDSNQQIILKTKNRFCRDTLINRFGQLLTQATTASFGATIRYQVIC